MLFASDELQLEFHKANTLMQALVTTFEGICFTFGEQVQVLEVTNPFACILGVELPLEAINDVVGSFNATYPRKGYKNHTLEILDKETGLYQILADSGKNLFNLN